MDTKEIVRMIGYIVGLGVLAFLVVTGKASVETLMAFVGGLAMQGLPKTKGES